MKLFPAVSGMDKLLRPHVVSGGLQGRKKELEAIAMACRFRISGPHRGLFQQEVECVGSVKFWDYRHGFPGRGRLSG